MPHRRRSLAVFALLAALAAAGCGGEAPPEPELIPTDQGEKLLDLLADAEQQFQDDECDELQGTLQEINDEVSAIPNEQVDPDILKTLNSGTEGLVPLSNRCQEPVPVAPPAPETTAPPEPVEPTTTQETVTEEQTTTEEATTEEEPPPEEPPEGEGNPPETPPGQENGNSGSNSGEGGGGED